MCRNATRGLSVGLQSSGGERAPKQGMAARKELSWHCQLEREVQVGTEEMGGPQRSGEISSHEALAPTGEGGGGQVINKQKYNI